MRFPSHLLNVKVSSSFLDVCFGFPQRELLHTALWFHCVSRRSEVRILWKGHTCGACESDKTRSATCSPLKVTALLNYKRERAPETWKAPPHLYGGDTEANTETNTAVTSVHTGGKSVPGKGSSHCQGRLAFLRQPGGRCGPGRARGVSPGEGGTGAQAGSRGSDSVGS